MMLSSTSSPSIYFGLNNLPDYVLLYTCLTAVVLTGIYAGRNVKTIKDYALASKKYNSGVLLITFLATHLGASSSTGLSAWVMQQGLISLLPLLGLCCAPLVIGWLVIPRIRLLNTDALTMAERMGHFYGPFARLITGVMGAVSTVFVLGGQIVALSALAKLAFGSHQFEAVGIAGSLIILYTALGGIRSIVWVNVLQFIIMVGPLPLIATLAVHRIGGIAELLQALPPYHLSWSSHPNFGYYFGLFLVFLMPALSLSPPTVQRMLMAHNNKQLRYIFFSQAGFTAIFLLTITLLGFTAKVLFPNLIDSNLALPYTILRIAPVGLKGIAIAGFLAIIMSTADAFLHTGSLFLIHDVFTPIVSRYRFQVNPLHWIPLAAVLLCTCAMGLACYYTDVIQLNLVAMTLFASLLSIPFLMGLLGLKPEKKSFFTGFLGGLGAFSLAHVALPPAYTSFAPLVGMGVNSLVFLGTHYIVHGAFIWEKKAAWGIIPVQYSWRQLLVYSVFRILPHRMANYVRQQVQRYGSHHMLFSSFFCLNSFLPLLMFGNTLPTHYPTIMLLWLAGSLLCVGLLLERSWPKRLHKFFPYYWYFTLMLCLPGLSNAVYVWTGGSTESLFYVVFSTLLLAWLVEWRSFLLLKIIGGGLGMMLALQQTHHTLSSFLEGVSLGLLAYTYLFSILVGLVFFRKKDQDLVEQVSLLRKLGGSVAHEVANGLGLSRSYVSILNLYLRSLTPERKKSSKSNENEEEIKLQLTTTLKDFNLIQTTLDGMQQEYAQGLRSIRRILHNTQLAVDRSTFERLPIDTCVQAAVAAYGLRKSQMEHLDVHLDGAFEFVGDETAFQHILFNLFKNSYTFAREDCSIKIFFKKRTLCFEDNGNGITPDVLPYIFEPFFTTSTTGVGLGLTYCQYMMDAFGGSIHCVTHTGENAFTRFELHFPPLP